MAITDSQWKEIRKHLSKTSLRRWSFATVNDMNEPHVAPIASLFLRDDKTGFFFDILATNTSKNLENNNKVCVMTLTQGKMFWFKALRKGKFPSPCGIRLKGTVGEKRKSTEEEITTFRKVIHRARKMKGYNILWKNLDYVRDITFEDYIPMNMRSMTYIVE